MKIEYIPPAPGSPIVICEGDNTTQYVLDHIMPKYSWNVQVLERLRARRARPIPRGNLICELSFDVYRQVNTPQNGEVSIMDAVYAGYMPQVAGARMRFTSQYGGISQIRYLHYAVITSVTPTHIGSALMLHYEVVGSGELTTTTTQSLPA